METPTHTVPFRLPNGTIMQVEVRGTAERDVSALTEQLLPDELANTISGLAELVDGAVQHVKPDRVNVEFGLEIGFGTGKITTLLVNGTMKGNLKIALEWKPQGD